LLQSVVTLIKERRLRLALQQLLARLLIRWRSHANTQVPEHPDRRDADAGGDRMSELQHEVAEGSRRLVE
jgi:hypothetical protein